MLLCEIFESNYPFELSYQVKDRTEYDFEAKNHSFTVTIQANASPMSDAVEKINEPIYKENDLYRWIDGYTRGLFNETGWSFDVTFGVAGSSSFDLTFDNEDQFKIISTVIKILLDYATKAKVLAYTFGAVEPKRISAYDKITKKMSSHSPFRLEYRIPEDGMVKYCMLNKTLT